MPTWDAYLVTATNADEALAVTAKSEKGAVIAACREKGWAGIFVWAKHPCASAWRVYYARIAPEAKDRFCQNPGGEL